MRIAIAIVHHDAMSLVELTDALVLEATGPERVRPEVRHFSETMRLDAAEALTTRRSSGLTSTTGIFSFGFLSVMAPCPSFSVFSVYRTYFPSHWEIQSQRGS